MLIINISESKFPAEALKTLAEFKGEDDKSILLSPERGHQKVFTADNLKIFTDYAKENLPKGRFISLYNSPDFTDDEIKVMLNNRDLVQLLKPFEFERITSLELRPNIMEFILDNQNVNERLIADKNLDSKTYFTFKRVVESQVISENEIMEMLNNRDFVQFLNMHELTKMIFTSEKIADFALTNKNVIEKLNNDNKNIDRQTFESSCAARCILRVLWEHNLLPKESCTPAKEFEIYKQIWVAPGSIASPDKIINFLNTYGMKVGGIDVKEISESKMSSDSSLVNAHSFFKAVLGSNLVVVNQGNIDVKTFGVGVSTLLVEDGPHVVFAKMKADGRFEVTNPTFGVTRDFESFQKYCDEAEKFLGLAFVAEKPAP